MRGIAAGDLRRLEVGTNDAFRRAGLLDFGDYRGLTAGNLVADGADEIARLRLRGSFCLDRGERSDGLGGRDFLALGGDDPVEDVARHYFASLAVHWTNWSSLARAAPLAIASRALDMPSPMLSATLAT